MRSAQPRTQYVQRLKMRDNAPPVLLIAEHRLRLALGEMRLQQDVVFLGKPPTALLPKGLIRPVSAIGKRYVMTAGMRFLYQTIAV